MSSKNQSETSAAMQEETREIALDNSVQIEADGATPENPAAETAVAPDEDSATTAKRPGETADDAEIKVTDKRRFVAAVGNSDDSSEEVTEAMSDAFEINIDQLQLDSEAVERELEELRDKLKESEMRRDEAMKSSEEYADRFRKAQLQLRAETEEVRARMQRSFEQRLEIARGDVVAGLLDTLDNLQRALVASEVVMEQGAAFDALRDGVRATAEMFEIQLKKLGLQALESEGEPFNPEIHEAVELAIAPKEQDNLVLAELQRGYKFGERLLRPARVKVGRAE